MPTIQELKEKLRSRGLSVSGSKQQLLNRLDTKKKTASVKTKKKIQLTNLDKNPLAVFYITTYFQKPNSKMAKNWINSQGITKIEAKHFFNKIMKKT